MEFANALWAADFPEAEDLVLSGELADADWHQIEVPAGPIMVEMSSDGGVHVARAAIEPTSDQLDFLLVPAGRKSRFEVSPNDRALWVRRISGTTTWSARIWARYFLQVEVTEYPLPQFGGVVRTDAYAPFFPDLTGAARPTLPDGVMTLWEIPLQPPEGEYTHIGVIRIWVRQVDPFDNNAAEADYTEGQEYIQRFSTGTNSLLRLNGRTRYPIEDYIRVRGGVWYLYPPHAQRAIANVKSYFYARWFRSAKDDDAVSADWHLIGMAGPPEYPLPQTNGVVRIDRDSPFFPDLTGAARPTLPDGVMTLWEVPLQPPEGEYTHIGVVRIWVRQVDPFDNNAAEADYTEGQEYIQRSSTNSLLNLNRRTRYPIEDYIRVRGGVWYLYPPHDRRVLGDGEVKSYFYARWFHSGDDDDAVSADWHLIGENLHE